MGSKHLQHQQIEQRDGPDGHTSSRWTRTYRGGELSDISVSGGSWFCQCKSPGRWAYSAALKEAMKEPAFGPHHRHCLEENSTQNFNNNVTFDNVVPDL
ncbi:hypothetical protein COCON_G00180680 [Conger conger]|uniref:Uncharacterized protein n=1 Tax=Conger conger TaxID=82655 RepID=A0A9Q1D5N8_CONCO|nr:hypothetical protein COCON_G00180680 [Conger conger]